MASTIIFVGFWQRAMWRHQPIPCFDCGHPFKRHRKQRTLSQVDQFLKCRYCDCVVRVPLPVDGRLEVEGRAAVSGVSVDTQAPFGASPVVATSRNAPNDAADPALYLRVDTNTHALHGGVGQECALCTQTIRPGQAVRKHYDGTYVHDVCPPSA